MEGIALSKDDNFYKEDEIKNLGGCMKIEAYSFGTITIDGKTYHKDIILFPDSVRPNWRRKEGHSLLIEDLQEVIEYRPEILIVGTGAYGVLQVPAVTKKALKKLDIELVEKHTSAALNFITQY